MQGRLEAVPFAAKVALLGTLLGALVHAAIVPTPWADARVTAVLFVADTVGFAIASRWTFSARQDPRAEPAERDRLIPAPFSGGAATAERPPAGQPMPSASIRAVMGQYGDPWGARPHPPSPRSSGDRASVS